MGEPRTIPLLDPKVQPSSWNERMVPGEYAILYSSLPGGTSYVGPVCTIFDTLAEAEEYATRYVADAPDVRCRIYDHGGLGGTPVREIRGGRYKGDSEISARFRRWGGLGFFLGGAGLVLMDWLSGFRLTWPATIGIRMLPVGLVLLVTDAVITFDARRKSRRVGQSS
ncbi:hypothetical protein [Granulicella arctica]|uniref:Uncharacterized protein n=1 Tax=Granulicella arctica TaxID=940613 RepID=A0A7Y9TUZ8_9BACT|nr:hypothetical protein [Granulicella arctica]NYF81283.1 hypothetical protein [Granulicella arctica]